MKKIDIIKNGILKENPIFVLLLGLCSALAITTSVTNAIGMGMAVIAVTICSNIIISLIRNITPNEIRIPVFIVIIATLVKCVQLLMNAYMFSVYQSLGVFIQLIVVNCMILGRAEAFASKNNVFDSFLDAVGMGFGYTIAIIIVAFFRELLGTGAINIVSPFDASVVLFNISLFKDYAIGIFKQPAGAFITLGVVLGIINTVSLNRKRKEVKS